MASRVRQWRSRVWVAIQHRVRRSSRLLEICGARSNPLQSYRACGTRWRRRRRSSRNGRKPGRSPHWPDGGIAPVADVRAPLVVFTTDSGGAKRLCPLSRARLPPTPPFPDGWFDRGETAQGRKELLGAFGGQKMSRSGHDDHARSGDRLAQRLTRGAGRHEVALVEHEQRRNLDFGGGGKADRRMRCRRRDRRRVRRAEHS